MLSLSVLATGCTTSPLHYEDRFKGTTNEECRLLMKRAPWENEVLLLGVTQDLFYSECWPEVLRLGGLLRSKLRDKHYSVIGEVGSIFFPEKETQTYVLESHERVYLTLLMSISSLRLGDRAGAEIELRRANDEMNAILYNYGADRMNSALIASLWEEFGEPEMARPYWKRLGVENASRGKRRVFGVGKIGNYDWSLKGDKGSVYKIQYRDTLPQSCVSKTGLVVPATDWVEKMSLRHSSDYHPLLNLKTYVRVPVAAFSSTVVGFSGALIAIGGCGIVVAAAAQSNSHVEGVGDLCGTFIKAGGAVMEEAPGFFDVGAQPDLRHWPKTPAALLITVAPSMNDEECTFESVGNQKTTPLL